MKVVLERLCFLFKGIPGSLSQSEALSLSDDLSEKKILHRLEELHLHFLGILLSEQFY